MTICPIPECGGEAKPIFDTGGTTFWKCDNCGKMVSRPKQTRNGQVNGQKVIECAGEFEWK